MFMPYEEERFEDAFISYSLKNGRYFEDNFTN